MEKGWSIWQKDPLANVVITDRQFAEVSTYQLGYRTATW